MFFANWLNRHFMHHIAHSFWFHHVQLVDVFQPCFTMTICWRRHTLTNCSCKVWPKASLGLTQKHKQYLHLRFLQVVVSNIYYVHPYLGKINLTNIFQRGWNHQLVLFFSLNFPRWLLMGRNSCCWNSKPTTQDLSKTEVVLRRSEDESIRWWQTCCYRS